MTTVFTQTVVNFTKKNNFLKIPENCKSDVEVQKSTRSTVFYEKGARKMLVKIDTLYVQYLSRSNGKIKDNARVNKHQPIPPTNAIYHVTHTYSTTHTISLSHTQN